ncbi:uncharacterized protein LOC104694408 [Corvus cornix cornix]|uniref:uncharacterized protein LOC104694408 n=1 Tax=Corvus cornix cornix TaxID=932674 RepID=UPI00194F7333|nr:uncharacterized protein LOC104694408 [Corvus cornix cornix]
MPAAGRIAQLAKAAAADARGTLLHGVHRAGTASWAHADCRRRGSKLGSGTASGEPRSSAAVGKPGSGFGSAELRPGAAALNAAGERETAAVSAAAPNVAAEQGPVAVPGTAAARGPTTVPNAAAEQEMSVAPDVATVPETVAAAAIPVRSGPAEMASRKEATVQTAAQPAVVCAVCSAASQPSQSSPLHPPLFAPSISELPLPDDSSSGSEADTGVRWLPSKCVCPDLRHQRQNRQPPNDDQNADHSNGDQNIDHQPNDSSEEYQDVNHQADGPSTSRDWDGPSTSRD